METNYRNTNINQFDNTSITGSNVLMRSVFSWMTLALVITTIASMLFAYIPQLETLLYQQTEMGIRLTTFAYIVMFAPLGFVLLMSFGFNKLSYPALIGVFLTYAAVNGISLSFIFHVYNLGSILNVFLSSVALFAVMAVAGYTAKTDLTKLRNILMIGLIGIVIAGLINFFMQSTKLSYICSFIGVVVFTGLTAYDIQKIKELSSMDDGSTSFRKLAITGALTLYLDFINIFLHLLRLFGGRKD